MIDDVILNYFDKQARDYRTANCVRAHNLLLKIGSVSHIDTYLVIESYSDEYDSGEYYERIENLLKEHLIENITEFGVTIKHEKIDILIEVLEALYSIPEREDKEHILSILEGDYEPVDILNDILCHMYARHEIDYLEVIDTVSSELIERITSVLSVEEEKDIYEDYIELETKEEIERTKIIKTYKHMLTLHTPILFNKLIEEGTRLGYSLETYLMQLDELDVEYTSSTYADEYLAAYVAAGEDLEKIQPKLSTLLEKLFDNPVAISKTMHGIMIKVNKIKEFTYHG